MTLSQWLTKLPKNFFHFLFSEDAKKSVFEKIAKGGLWESDGSTISGSGSTVDANKERVKFLGQFIERYEIKHIIDIPCGDCNWQHTIPNIENLDYFGADISEAALSLAKQKNAKRTHMRFAERSFDLCSQVPEVTDGSKTLMIIKEVIQHLSLEDGVAAITNARRSQARFLAITNHDQKLFDVERNVDIETGAFYPNNVLLPPFNLRNPIADIAEDLPENLQASYGNLMIFDLYEN